MAYCTNCGSSITSGSKFCPGCGTELTIAINKNISTKIKEEKEETKKSKIKNPNQNESKLEKTLTLKTPAENNTQNSSKRITNKKYKLAKRLMIYFFLLNIPIYFLNKGDNELLGILILSVLEVIDFLIFLINKKKEKPFNNILKIVLIIQILLIISYLYRNFEFIGDTVNSIVAVITLSLLFMVNVVLIAKGNKE